MTGWCCCYFPPTVRPFVGLYDIELGDQELHNSYPLTFYGLMGCTLCPRRESNRWPQRFSVDRQHSAALGERVCHTWQESCPCRSPWDASPDSHKVKTWSGSCFPRRRRDEEGRGETSHGDDEPPPPQPNVMKGAAHHRHGNPANLSNIWCWSAARLWWGQGGWRMEVDEFDRSSGKEPKRRKMKRNEREWKKNPLGWNKF